MNQLQGLKQWTTVVADTGDFQQIAQFCPRDATTNPSLILKAVQKAEYAPLVKRVLSGASKKSVEEQLDRLIVGFGLEILKVVPGRVSTEVDARLSFDKAATIARAHQLVEMYRAEGVDVEHRVLIKIASTWEGIEAARQLELEGVHTNLTLLFSRCQAIACGNAKVQLISPFVGRIYDWYKKQAGAQWDEQAMSGVNDPGVRSVREIYSYYKQHGIATEVMGASFRNVGQVLALAGCDLLTISPELLNELAQSEGAVRRQLHAESSSIGEATHYSEAAFRLALNEDAMATEKLAEGIRAFVSDAKKLELLLTAGT